MAPHTRCFLASASALGLCSLLASCSPSAATKDTGAAATETKPTATAPREPAEAVVSKTFAKTEVEVACGRCIYEMKDVEGCPWAAKIDGKSVLIEGKTPTKEEHDSHADDGMCKTTRTAVVTGELRGDKLVLSEMTLVLSAVKTDGEGQDHDHDHAHGHDTHDHPPAGDDKPAPAG